jgi:hypothetical protein
MPLTTIDDQHGLTLACLVAADRCQRLLTVPELPASRRIGS